MEIPIWLALAESAEPVRKNIPPQFVLQGIKTALYTRCSPAVHIVYVPEQPPVRLHGGPTPRGEPDFDQILKRNMALRRRANDERRITLESIVLRRCRVMME
jgi:hypothetical protein